MLVDRNLWCIIGLVLTDGMWSIIARLLVVCSDTDCGNDITHGFTGVQETENRHDKCADNVLLQMFIIFRLKWPYPRNLVFMSCMWLSSQYKKGVGYKIRIVKQNNQRGETSFWLFCQSQKNRFPLFSLGQTPFLVFFRWEWGRHFWGYRCWKKTKEQLSRPFSLFLGCNILSYSTK